MAAPRFKLLDHNIYFERFLLVRFIPGTLEPRNVRKRDGLLIVATAALFEEIMVPVPGIVEIEGMYDG